MLPGDLVGISISSLSYTQAELKEQDQNILQSFLSVRNTLYSIWETHRLIVKDQEEMKFYDDRSDASSPAMLSPTSPIEKVPLGRLGSGLFSSIQKQSEERGITSPITKKPMFTIKDVQEVDTTNDTGPPGSFISEDRPWYDTDSSDTNEQSAKPTATFMIAQSNYKSPSKSSLHQKKKEHIYESIDDVLAELRQNQGASPNYATLHRWTSQLTTPGSTGSSSSGSAALDSKFSSSQVSARSSDDLNSTSSSVPPKSSSEHDSVNASSVNAPDRRHSKSSKANSGAKQRKNHSYSASNVKMTQDGASTPPLPPMLFGSGNQLDAAPQVRQHNKKLSFPEVTIPSVQPSSQARHNRQPSGPELLNSSPSNTPEAMVRSQSARWVRRQSHQPGRSQSPTLKSPSANKEGYLTPQLSRNVQNGVQQSPNSRYTQNDDYNPLAEENSVSSNFSNELLSLFNFQQSFHPTAVDKHSSRTASSSSSVSSHGRRSVPMKPSPSPDLCVNPLGGPLVSPPPVDNQASMFCHVSRRQSGNINLTAYNKSVSNTGDAALPKLSNKRSISTGATQGNVLTDTNVLPDYHPASTSVQHRNSLPYQNTAMPPSPGVVRRDSNDPTKRDIVDCPNSPRFPKRSLNRSAGQAVVVKGTNTQAPQPRIAKFTAPPPPTVAPPKAHQQYSTELRPLMSGHVRPSKVEQTWC